MVPAHNEEFSQLQEQEKRRTSPLSVGQKDRGQGRRRRRHNGKEDRQVEWSYKSKTKRTQIMSNDTIHGMRLDQEILEPMLSPIVADIYF